MNSIGWRICFWLGLLVGLVGLFLRSKAWVSENMGNGWDISMHFHTFPFFLDGQLLLESVRAGSTGGPLQRKLMSPSSSLALSHLEVSDPEEFVQAREFVAEMNQHPLYVLWRQHRLDVLLMVGVEAITPAAWYLGNWWHVVTLYLKIKKSTRAEDMSDKLSRSTKLRLPLSGIRISFGSCSCMMARFHIRNL